MLGQAREGQVSSASQVSSAVLTTYDLRILKVITSSSKLRFWCS